MVRHLHLTIRQSHAHGLCHDGESNHSIGHPPRVSHSPHSPIALANPAPPCRRHGRVQVHDAALHRFWAHVFGGPKRKRKWVCQGVSRDPLLLCVGGQGA